ncbi:MAG: pimeloyl-ACP methyl ester carboxylesterase [Myxococcota bacterium]|jgi:pimeloyl-ACP methyl ester carboxylesterase
MRIVLLAALMMFGMACDDDAPSDTTDTAVDTTAVDTTVADTTVADTAADTTVEDTTPADDTVVPGCSHTIEERTVTFVTSDGVTLEGDYTPAALPSAPAVVLLHMIPPSNTRANYPPAFRQMLADKGFHVLNVDRRGAGGSGGTARDAYTGSKGKLDAQAAMDFLAAAFCPPDPANVALVGASNGTTTVIDYTVDAASNDAYPLPAALVLLTGGGYTENQNAIDDNRGVLETLPVRFVFSTAERLWSAAFDGDDAPEVWVFDEYPGGAHGTGMFNTKPESMGAVVDFIDGSLTAE